jgi:hypothetical protein
MVQFNQGPGRWDAVAANWDSSKKWNANAGRSESNCLSIIGCLPFFQPILAKKLSKAEGSYQSERYFVSGNERSVFNYYKSDPENGIPGTGYQLKSTDSFAYLLELMNMNEQDEVVYLTMTYDILDK